MKRHLNEVISFCCFHFNWRLAVMDKLFFKKVDHLCQTINDCLLWTHFFLRIFFCLCHLFMSIESCSIMIAIKWGKNIWTSCYMKSNSHSQTVAKPKSKYVSVFFSFSRLVVVVVVSSELWVVSSSISTAWTHDQHKDKGKWTKKCQLVFELLFF